MKKLNLGFKLLAWAAGHVMTTDEAPEPVQRYGPPKLPPGVIPEDMAMDSSVYSYANDQCTANGFAAFPGYQVLAELATRPEYRMLSEKTAAAMVRKWIKLSSKKGDKNEKIDRINEIMENLRVRDLFGEVAQADGLYGRAQLFIDLGEQRGSSLELPILLDKAVLKGKLRKFKYVEAMYTYPNEYDASNPLSDSYYNPRSWFVMGQKVHSSRLLTFVGNPVATILRPAYNFGGVSMTQQAIPYVENWLRTRTSIGRLISNFSTTALQTNMDSVMMGDSGDDLMARGELFTKLRDNQGLMMIDKETEDLKQVNAPLQTLDTLQAQSQEHMASVAGMPISVLFGITPAGLNASAEGDIKIFHEHVLDRQNRLFRPNLTMVINIIQISEFGDIDPDIKFDFLPLWEQSETEAAATRKSDAECAAILVDIGAISAEEVREKLSRDEHSGYNGLELGAMPEVEDNGEDR